MKVLQKPRSYGTRTLRCSRHDRPRLPFPSKQLVLSQLLCVTVLLAHCSSALAAESLALAEGGTTQYVIVLPTDPAAPIQTAAKELQQFLRQVTGATFRITSETETPAAAPQIILGVSDRCRKRLPKIDLSQLKHDGIVVKTIGNSLILAGRPPRGTLYAVYTFLEDIVGCRWWTSTESHIPKRATLRVSTTLDIQHAPRLRYREAFYQDTFDSVTAARFKLNGHHHRVTPEYGGHYQFVGFVHTFYPFLPPAKYFADHPEWYSELKGKRTAERAQLCLTNSEMRKEMVKVALQQLRSQPDAGFISISQNDWHGQCQCESCRTVEAEEGSPSGPLIRFVNAVAKEIEKEFPDVLVETLAYQYTRKPPLHVKPRKNVVVRLCSIECSFIQPLATGEQNKAFREDIEGWSKIAPQLFVWDYVTNFSSYIVPHPNLRVLAPNIRFFTENKVIGLFEQGDSQSVIGDFLRLRAWLLAHLMWDPDRDADKLIAEFLHGYYGPAAPYLQQYLKIIHDAGERSKVYLRCFMNDTSDYLTLDDLNAATRAFDKAQAAVADDPVLAQRVQRERLPLDHVWLQRYYALRRTARIQKKDFCGPKDPAAACKQFIQRAHHFKVGNYRERHAFAEYEPILRARLRPVGPPPPDCRNLPEADWLDFQDNQLRLGRVGQWTELVKDPAASDEMAVRMPGSHREWAVSQPLRNVFKAPQRWRCVVVARAEATAKSGLAMTMGIYDTKNRKAVAQRRIAVKDATGPEYHAFDLGTHQLDRNMYIWVAPPERPNDVQAVFIDRIYLIRTPVEVQVKPVATLEDGTKVDQYTMTNSNGMQVSVINYGATITRVVVPDRDGQLDNITLHFNDPQRYLKGHPLFGSIVGRYANRIANARFTIAGKEYPLTPNAGQHHIHGGRQGFQRILWSASVIQTDDTAGGTAGVEFKHASPDGHEGYPGNLNVTLRYTLSADNQLTLEYRASTDKPTHVNLTNHTYWNLSGIKHGNVLDQVMMINAAQYLEASPQRFPSGKLLPVAGTPLDFQTPHTIGARIKQLPGENYDDCYVIQKKPGQDFVLAARVEDKKSGRVMEVHTTAPGVQFYTAKGLDGTLGTDGVAYGPYHGFCLETQHFPDSPNQPNFPSTLVRPDQPYHQTTVYRFSIAE